MAKEYRLGVLFVHGIGEQQQGSTLLKWAAAVVGWLNRWLGVLSPPDEKSRAEKPQAEVFAIHPRPADADTPGHCKVVLSLPKGSPPKLEEQKWLLAESWWASVISPPRFGQLARWAVPMAPWLAYEYAVAAGTTQHPCEPELSRKSSPKWLTVHALGLVIPVVALVLMAFVLLLDLLQRLPLIGRSVTKLVGKFEQGVGDAYLFCLDGPARGAMKQRISRDIAWLLGQCDHVVVVAHSQGAALCHDVLAGATKLRPSRAVDVFVTVGSGVRRLYNMRKLYGDQRLLSLGWQGVLAALAWATGLLVAGIAVAAGGSQAAVLAGAVLLLLGLVWHARVHGRIADQVTKPLPELALPDTSTKKWIDYYATADPVPNGQICTDAREQGRVDVESCVVHNYRSVSKDHSAYVDNADQVLTRLAVHLGESAGTDLGLKITDPTVQDGWRLRRWRTMCRAIARNLLLATGIAAAVLLSLPAASGSGWARLGRGLGVVGGDPGQPAAALLSLKTWLEKRPLLGLQSLIKAVGPETFVGVTVALAVVVLSAGWLAWRWSRWDAGDLNRLFGTPQDAALAGGPRMPRTAWVFWLLVASFAVGSTLVAATFGPLHGGWLAVAWGVVILTLAATGWLLQARRRIYFSAMDTPSGQADQNLHGDSSKQPSAAARPREFEGAP